MADNSNLHQLASMSVEAYANKRTPSGFIHNWFFSQRIARENSIEIQSKEYTNQAAQRVASIDSDYRKISKTNGKGIRIDFGHIKDEVPILLSDGIARVFGSNIGDFHSSPEAQRLALVDEIDEEINRVHRAYDLACLGVLTTGVTIGAEDKEYDLGKDPDLLLANNTLPDAQKWTHQDSNPVNSLFDLANKLRSKGTMPTDVLMGHEAYSALINNPKFLMQGQNVQTRFGSFDLTERRDTENKMMGISIDGMNIWLCTETYSDAGTDTQFVDPKTILLLKRDPSLCRLAFGNTGRFDIQTPRPINIIMGSDTKAGTSWMLCHSAFVAYMLDPNISLHAQVVA